VLGVVFAAAVSLNKVGYALTAAQVAADVQQGKNSTGSVSTAGCA
jgi:hypothetical protein